MRTQYQTPEFIQKKGVVLSREMVPYDSALTFNAGIARRKDGYIMLFRNDYNFCKKDYDDFYAGIADNTTPKINIGAAVSPDGRSWKVLPEPVFAPVLPGVRMVYDPRITVMDNGECVLCFAVAGSGTRGGIAVTEDFVHFDIKSISVPENRNMVVFPEKIGGEYVRLERPFYVNDKNHAIWLSRSPDLIHWGESALVLTSGKVPYSNL